MPLSPGPYASLITPRRPGLHDINLGEMWDLIDFVTERKVTGIVLLGLTGEFIHFNSAERIRLTALAPRRSRVPVLINVSHSTLDGAIELAQAAEEAGAAALVLMPPYFYQYDEDAIRTFYEQFAAETRFAIPTLACHTPRFGAGLSCPVVSRLIDDGVVQGIEDASGDAVFLTQMQDFRKRKSFHLLIGDDAQFSVSGGGGVISPLACAIPELAVAFHCSLVSGTLASAGIFERRVTEWLEWTERFPVPVCIREAVRLRGLKPGPDATPLSAAGEHRLTEFRQWFKSWLEVVLKECRNA